MLTNTERKYLKTALHLNLRYYKSLNISNIIPKPYLGNYSEGLKIFNERLLKNNLWVDLSVKAEFIDKFLIKNIPRSWNTLFTFHTSISI